VPTPVEVRAITILLEIDRGRLTIEDLKAWLDQGDEYRRAFIKIGEALRFAAASPGVLNQALLSILEASDTRH
jgi:hypothetical protein